MNIKHFKKKQRMTAYDEMNLTINKFYSKKQLF